MQVYKSKYGRLPGTSFAEVMATARREYHAIQKRTPRRIPYVRSGYFTKDKVFLNTFWDHLKQEHPADQLRRLKFYAVAIDLLRNSKEPPDTIFARDNMDTLLHRFQGSQKTSIISAYRLSKTNEQVERNLYQYFRQKQRNKKDSPLM